MLYSLSFNLSLYVCISLNPNVHVKWTFEKLFEGRVNPTKITRNLGTGGEWEDPEIIWKWWYSLYEKTKDFRDEFINSVTGISAYP